MRTTHSTGAFLNSCLKVPIDPCNNCPAPIYNRPKMYLGRLTTTTMATPTSLSTYPLHKSTITTTLRGIDNTESDVMCTNEIRSLAKFYDSIPDYCDINHLSETEFYTTLDTLRTTCRRLKTKSLESFQLEEHSSVSSLSTQCELLGDGKSKKSISIRKRSVSAKNGKRKSYKKNQQCSKQESRYATTPCCVDSKIDMLPKTKVNNPKSFKLEAEHEMKAFKQSLKNIEKEFRRPLSSISSNGKITKANQKSDKFSEKTPTIINPKSENKENFRKSFSCNDLCSIEYDSVCSPPIKNAGMLTRSEALVFKDRAKLSNYFVQKPSNTDINLRQASAEIPKIIVDSPISESSKSVVRSKKYKFQKYEKPIQVPFSLFELSDRKNENVEQSPSPMHPAARPNLAATLRAEVSRKKLKELQNNCTFYDDTQNFDWEVRKTPAWKTLSMNESHKEILSHRLATRKAEQALQKREYDLNMELMRQRVKSAPLLLEGTTYWGPKVGKLTHSCQNDGILHVCQINQRKQRKKITNKRTTAESECSFDIHMTSKMNTLRKLYANSAKSHSRNSQDSRVTSTQKQDRPTIAESKRKQNQSNSESNKIIDSGDEGLSSVDRAYL